MRTSMIALALLATAPAVAQTPALDGKASLSSPIADVLIASGQVTTKEAVRSLIIAFISKTPQAPEEKDFFAELASGAAVETSASGRTIHIAPLQVEALKVAKLLITAPNLNSLWKQSGEPAEQMLEVSRWGDRGRNRITGYMANMFYSAWAKSTLQNGYTPWMQEYQGANGAFERLTDPALVREAKLLVKDAMVQVFAKCKADGREPPPLFLYDIPLTSVGVPRPQ